MSYVDRFHGDRIFPSLIKLLTHYPLILTLSPPRRIEFT